MLSALRIAVLRALLRVAWSVGGHRDEVDGLPRLHPEDVEAIRPHLRPGDIVLLGNNGRLTHVAVHAGDGHLIHAMATEKTMRGWLGSLWDAAWRALGGEERQVGVIDESLPAFLARYERDTWVILRHEGLVGDALERGLERVRALVGRPYDYGFRLGDEAWYCTEVVDELLKAGLGEAAPAIPTVRHRVPLLLDEEVIEPVALLHTPGLQVVAANEAARRDYAQHLAEAPVLPLRK